MSLILCAYFNLDHGFLALILKNQKIDIFSLQDFLRFYSKSNLHYFNFLFWTYYQILVTEHFPLSKTRFNEKFRFAHFSNFSKQHFMDFDLLQKIITRSIIKIIKTSKNPRNKKHIEAPKNSQDPRSQKLRKVRIRTSH